MILKEAAVVGDELRRELTQALERLGIEVTGIGKATVSCRMDLDEFKDLFGISPKEIAAEPPGDRDMGTAGGFYTEESLTVPTELEPFVRRITMIPPPRRL
jgi:hypothetical protein